MTDAVLKVMILDDDGAIRESFGNYFEDHGFQPLPLASAEAALERLDSLSPDVAIVDIRLGGMSGDEFIHEVYDRLPHCVFIICTGSPAYGIPDFLSALERVSSSIFQKPVADLSLLQHEVLRMVGRSHKGAGMNGDA